MAPCDNNPFSREVVAQLYAVARPYFHPLVVSRISAFTSSPRFHHALDVACGTGHSARAIAEICGTVEGIDASSEMIAAALPHERVRYQVAPAEGLPFPDQHFDLVTVGMAYHWFDQSAFLRESRRVMKPSTWLIVYNYGFNGEMSECAEFHHWARELYLRRLPALPRRSERVTDEDVSPHGLKVSGTARFTTEETMTVAQLTAYLLTQTNGIAAVEGGAMSPREAAEWIESGVAPFFKSERSVMKFSGSIW